ncbi:MAG: DMT family transporter [Desulfomonilaceae bacterium]
MSAQRIGYLCVTMAALCWAASGAAAKNILEGGISPSALVQVRVTLASLLLGGYFGLFRRDLLTIRVGDVWLMAAIGVLMASVQFTYFFTISQMNVMAAVLLQYLAPFFVAMYAICCWGERFALYKIVSLVLAFAGCYLVVGGYNIELVQMHFWGIIGGLSAAVCYAAYALVGEKVMHRYRPWTAAFYALLVSAVVWNVIYPPLDFLTAPYDGRQWAHIVFVVLVGTIAPFGLYFVGVNYIRSTRAMITASLEPLASGVAAYLYLGEKATLPQALGALLVIIAIALLQLYQEKDPLAPAVIRQTK